VTILVLVGVVVLIYSKTRDKTKNFISKILGRSDDIELGNGGLNDGRWNNP